MADYVHCDGPNCTEIRKASASKRRDGEDWVHVARRLERADCCGIHCAISWLADASRSDVALGELRERLVAPVDKPGRKAELAPCPVTGESPCRYHPDGGNHPIVGSDVTP